MGEHNLLDYCTSGPQAVNDAQFVTVDTACGKHHDQQNLSKTITSYRNIAYITKSLQMFEDTNNPHL